MRGLPVVSVRLSSFLPTPWSFCFGPVSWQVPQTVLSAKTADGSVPQDPDPGESTLLERLFDTTNQEFGHQVLEGAAAAHAACDGGVAGVFVVPSEEAG